jgi:hypothetical protein
MKQEGLEPKHDGVGNTPQEVMDLIEAANRHVRALTLLSREIIRQGVRATTENLHRIMAELHRQFPDDREDSLYASVELSLRRLPLEMREQIKPLGVFYGGANLAVLIAGTYISQYPARYLSCSFPSRCTPQHLCRTDARPGLPASPVTSGECPEQTYLPHDLQSGAVMPLPAYRLFRDREPSAFQ